MAYIVELVDREFMPKGREWMLLEHPTGDVTFVIARDAGAFELSPDVLTAIVYPIARSTGLDFALVS